MYLHYILKDKIPVVCPDVFAWSKQFEDVELRRVAMTEICGHTVFTSFLGIDHRFGDDGPPLLFETMIRKGVGDIPWNACEWLDYQKRYSTWKEAEAGHQKACEWLKSFDNLVFSAKRFLRQSND